MAGASLRVGANTSEFTSQMKSMLTQMKLVTSEYNLNSTVILLISCGSVLFKTSITIFKFHCDSINI